ARIESTLRSDGRWCVKVERLVGFGARIAADRPDAIVLAAPAERAARLLEAMTASSPPVMLLAPGGGRDDWTSKKRAPNLRAALRDDAAAEGIQAALPAATPGPP